MITGELKNKIDSLWDIFAAGGLVNPLDVIEQITYLIYALYCFLCQCLAFVRAKKLYSQQKMKEKEKLPPQA